MRYPISAIQMLGAGKLDHPEGVAVGRDGTLYAGGEAGQVYRIREGGDQVEVIASTAGLCLGLALDPDEDLYVCDERHRAVYRVTQAGACTVLCDGCDGRRFVLPNFPVFDRQGRLYVSDSGSWKGGDGALFRIDRGGQVRVFHPGPFHYANGLCLDAAEEVLYVVESNLDRVLRVRIRPDGTAGAVSVFADGLHRVPDGLCLDAAGSLYVTCYANDRLYRVSPAGEVSILCEDPERYVLNQPTNCAFGGPDFDRLYVANLGATHLSVLDLRQTGQQLWVHNRSQPQT